VRNDLLRCDLVFIHFRREALMQTMSERSRWTALVVLCTGMLMIILDQTIVNVALPSIERDLGFSQSSLAWVVNAYLIAFGGLLLLAGRLGDLIGRRRVFLAGLGVFTAASALCGLAQDQGVLVVARFVQGAGGAATASVILGMIVTLFTEPAERAKALGVFSFVAAGGGSIGLLLGGVLTQALSWHWIFFVNLPIGAATAALALRYVPGDRGIGLEEGADVAGAALVTGGLMLAVYAIVKAAEYGWASAHTIGFGAAAVVLLVLFVIREARARTPLIPLRIFRERNLTGGNVVQALMVAAVFGMFFLGAVYLQRVLGYGPLDVGLAFLPIAVAIAILSIAVTPRLVVRFSPVATMIAGLVVMIPGLILWALAPVHADYLADLFIPMLLLGLGAGLFFPSLMTFVMSSATPEDSGLASGITNTAQQVGGALGLAVLATISSTRTSDLLHSGVSPASAFTSGFHLVLTLGAGFLVAAVILSVALLQPVTTPAVEAAPEAEDLVLSEAA
jgi:EmrB/QacA subfamily drug resistance transporter